MVVAAYNGYQLQPCSLSTVSSFSFSDLSRLGPLRNVRLYSAIGGESTSADTVVARCTKKIVDSLNPKECSVTSTDDDPNGSHVSCWKLLNSAGLRLTIDYIHLLQIQIVCVADAFEGKSSLQRQRLVYKAIWDEMSGPVHAVDSIIAKTPTEMGMWE